MQYEVKLKRFDGTGYKTTVTANNETQAYIIARNKISVAKNVPNNGYLINVSCRKLSDLPEGFDDIFKHFK